MAWDREDSGVGEVEERRDAMHRCPWAEGLVALEHRDILVLQVLPHDAVQLLESNK